MKARTLLIILAVMAAGFFLKACEGDPLGIFSDDPRDGLTGEWKVEENSSLFKKSTAGFYSVNISKDNSDTAKIYVSNFYELGQQLAATLNGRNLSIPEQILNGCTIKGYGLVSVDFGKIEWSYTVVLDTGDKDDVTATYTRPQR